MKQNQELSINIRGNLHDFSRPWIMGILNVTSDSFYEGCRAMDEGAILARVRTIRDEGADCIDIGACSTRPGSILVDSLSEWERLRQAILIVRSEWPDAIISVDTFRADVARLSIEAGADIINDISGGTIDENMFNTVAQLKVPYILTHTRGTPATMAQCSDYNDVVADVITELAFSLKQLRKLGVCDVIIDPGFGFAKDPEQNYKLLASLDEIGKIGLPVLVGISRKSMIWRPLGITPADALPGTIALNAFSLLHGASILRVHDVAAAVQTRDTLSLLNSDNS